LFTKSIAKLILALNGNEMKSEVAAGFAWGLLLGLVPLGNICWFVLFIVSFFFRHNHGFKMISLIVIKLLAPLFLPLIDLVGWRVLHIDALQGMFITMYNMPFVPFTKFNNTLVAGGLVGGAVLWLPAFFLSMALIPLYQEKVLPKIKNSKVFKKLIKLPFLSSINKAIAAAEKKRNA
jgi:uncharacterized protein (TIGR03546 family)